MSDLQAEAKEIIIEMAEFLERYYVPKGQLAINLLAKANILLDKLAMKEGV
jgi:hypothetical protein